MDLMIDSVLVTEITSKSPIIENLTQPVDFYSKDSPVQASSVDLHIGPIFLPDTKDDETGSERNPKKEHVLRTGETSVVATKETLHFPPDVAGIGFPPARISSLGLLMTNPGHKQLEAKWLRWGAIITATATLLGALASGVFLYRSNIEDLRKKTEILEHDLTNHAQVEQRLETLVHRLDALENALPRLEKQSSTALKDSTVKLKEPGKGK
jgi:hypothetical protein